MLLQRELPSSSMEEGQGGGEAAEMKVWAAVGADLWLRPALTPHHHPCLPPSRRKEI
jgi:hypothetical protein